MVWVWCDDVPEGVWRPQGGGERVYLLTREGEERRQWDFQWDGTPSSLEHKRGAGRPRLLSAAKVNENIRAPILERNCSHQAVHYTDLVDPIRERTGKNVSLRTDLALRYVPRPDYVSVSWSV